MGKHNTGGTCLKKKVPPQICKIQENITNLLFWSKKIKSYGKLEVKCIFPIYMFDMQIVTTFPRSGN